MPHTPPIADGFAREDFITPVAFELVEHPDQEHGSPDLAGFVLYATQNQHPKPYNLTVVESPTHKPLIKQ